MLRNERGVLAALTVVLLFAGGGGVPAFADWTATYDKSSGEDRANALAMDANGNFYCAGFTTTSGAYNLTVVKYSSGGTKLWDTTVATALNIRYDGKDVAIAIDSEGGVNVVGTTSNHNILTVKLNTSGTKLWERTYAPTTGHLNQGRGVTADSSGNVYAVGTADIGTTHEVSSSIVVIKYAASDGTQAWVRKYAGGENEQARGEAVAYDSTNSRLYAIGKTTGVDVSDFTTLRLNSSDGTFSASWSDSGYGAGVRREGSADMVFALGLDGSKNPVCAGSYTVGFGDYHFWALKYAGGNGSLTWENHSYDEGAGENKACALAFDGSNNVYVTGFVINPSATSNYTYDFGIVRYRYNDGVIEWHKTFNGDDRGEPYAKDDVPFGIAYHGGLLCVAGGTDGDWVNENLLYSSFQNARAIYLDPADGDYLGAYMLSGSDSSKDNVFHGVLFDASGKVVVTGYTGVHDTSSSFDFYTAKTTPATGD